MATGDATPERWRPVRGAEGSYEVSDQGRVRSVDRVVTYSDGRQRFYRGQLLRPATEKRRGYLEVALSVGNQKKTRLVHRLVLEAFVELRPEGQHGRHGPGGIRDNRRVNLCWGSAVENAADKERDGTLLCGDSHRGARLTEAVVLECRRRYAAGETQTALASEYSVSVSSMSLAVRGITWSHLPGAVPVRPGFAGHGAKLSPESAREVRRRYAAGESRIALAAEYGVTRSTVWRVIRGQSPDV